MVHEARYKRQKATPALITFLARTSHPFERVRGARGEESDVFSDAVDKAEAAVEAKRAPEEDMPGVQTTTGSELRGREEDVGEEKKNVELRMPRSFDFGDPSHGSGVAREADVGNVDLFDAVGMLGNLWRRMQLRWR